MNSGVGNGLTATLDVSSFSSFEHTAKIPYTTFYENPIHSEIIQQMHQSFLLGEHLLLIGPQG